MKILKSKTRGFTLIELMISMTIFIMFIGVLFGSYMAIVKGQRDANSYRAMYSESRRVFEKITDEVRNGIIYYPENTEGNIVSEYGVSLHSVVVLSKEMDKLSVFELDGGNLNYCNKSVTEDIDYKYYAHSGETYLLNSATKMKDFKVSVYPAVDPYRTVNTVATSLQFQPMVHIEATFEKEISGGNTFELTLSTSVSSRYYGESQMVQDAEGCSLGPDYFNFQDVNE